MPFMEAVTSTPHSPVRCRTLLIVLLLCALACTSCGPQVIEGRPPFVGVSAMQLAGDTLNVHFRISNQNGVPMNIEAIDMGITVKETQLIRENRPYQLAIDANSAEEIHVGRKPEPAMQDLLAELENREVASLPFRLQGSVQTVEDGLLRFEQKGHFYPVPGKPGHFRSAVTQAEELRREELR